jgi:hypothetical protein
MPRFDVDLTAINARYNTSQYETPLQLLFVAYLAYEGFHVSVTMDYRNRFSSTLLMHGASYN